MPRPTATVCQNASTSSFLPSSSSTSVHPVESTQDPADLHHLRSIPSFFAAANPGKTKIPTPLARELKTSVLASPSPFVGNTAVVAPKRPLRFSNQKRLAVTQLPASLRIRKARGENLSLRRVNLSSKPNSRKSPTYPAQRSCPLQPRVRLCSSCLSSATRGRRYSAHLQSSYHAAFRVSRVPSPVPTPLHNSSAGEGISCSAPSSSSSSPSGVLENRPVGGETAVEPFACSSVYLPPQSKDSPESPRPSLLDKTCQPGALQSAARLNSRPTGASFPFERAPPSCRHRAAHPTGGQRASSLPSLPSIAAVAEDEDDVACLKRASKLRRKEGGDIFFAGASYRQRSEESAAGEVRHQSTWSGKDTRTGAPKEKKTSPLVLTREQEKEEGSPPAGGGALNELERRAKGLDGLDPLVLALAQ